MSCSVPDKNFNMIDKKKEIVNIHNKKYFSFSSLIKATNKPVDPALLILLDLYQRSHAATEQQLIDVIIPEIRAKLCDIYDKL